MDAPRERTLAVRRFGPRCHPATVDSPIGEPCERRRRPQRAADALHSGDMLVTVAPAANRTLACKGTDLPSARYVPDNSGDHGRSGPTRTHVGYLGSRPSPDDRPLRRRHIHGST